MQIPWQLGCVATDEREETCMNEQSYAQSTSTENNEAALLTSSVQADKCSPCRYPSQVHDLRTPPDANGFVHVLCPYDVRYGDDAATASPGTVVWLELKSFSQHKCEVGASACKGILPCCTGAINLVQQHLKVARVCVGQVQQVLQPEDPRA